MLSELYGVTGWDFDFRGHKFQGDWQAALGVNVRVPHLAWQTMKGEGKRDYPASISYQSPWALEYKRIEDHYARINTALTRGQSKPRVAVIHPVESYGMLYSSKEESGHLNHTLHLISDLHDLHLRLMQQQELGDDYRQRYAHLAQHLPALRLRLGKESEMSDTELCFRALYAAMLYRIKGQGEKAVADTIEVVSPVIALLTNYYHKVEKGEIDLFKE
jgi:hypothetical protein